MQNSKRGDVRRKRNDASDMTGEATGVELLKSRGEQVKQLLQKVRKAGRCYTSSREDFCSFMFLFN